MISKLLKKVSKQISLDLQTSRFSNEKRTVRLSQTIFPVKFAKDIIKRGEKSLEYCVDNNANKHIITN